MTRVGEAVGVRIVYIWDADYPWDVRTEKTCRALVDAGHEVHIVARNREQRPVMERLPEGVVHRMHPWGWAGRKLNTALGFPAFFNPRWRALIRETARSVDADVIIVRDLPLCPAAISVGRRLEIPVILDMAEHYPAMIQAIWDSGRQRPLDWIVRNPVAVKRVERFCIRNVDHIITVADEMTERLVSMGVAPSSITCVSNTPQLSDRAYATPSPRTTNASIQLVYLGLMEIVRGINELIDAVALLRSRGVRTNLLLIGSGRDEQIFRERVASHGLTEFDVVFAGHLPYAHALGMMASADIGVLPLHRNAHMDTTVPNKLFDYMSLGLPVITSDTLPSARIVRAEAAGVVFHAKDAEALAEAIAGLSDDLLRQEMGSNGLEAVRRRYNWQKDAVTLVDSVVSVALLGRKRLFLGNPQ